MRLANDLFQVNLTGCFFSLPLRSHFADFDPSQYWTHHWAAGQIGSRRNLHPIRSIRSCCSEFSQFREAGIDRIARRINHQEGSQQDSGRLQSCRTPHSVLLQEQGGTSMTLRAWRRRKSPTQYRRQFGTRQADKIPKYWVIHKMGFVVNLVSNDAKTRRVTELRG